MKKIFISFWILSFCLLFISCSAVVKTSGPLENLPVSNVSPQDYKIQVGDTLDIKFFYHPELNESVIVRPDGRISLQLVHEVQASGLTPEMLRENLRRKYEAQISKPEIAVIVRLFQLPKDLRGRGSRQTWLDPLDRSNDYPSVHSFSRRDKGNGAVG